MDESLKDAVRKRARSICEYCKMPQAACSWRFQIDHIVARQHGGPTILSNLALACLHCNGNKGPNLAGIDPRTRKLTPLFHPRRHKWSRHFRWAGAYLVGRSSIGRTTIQVLALNQEELVAHRLLLIEEGIFPPPEP